MLGLFKKNLFFNSLLMFPLICLLRINTFLNPEMYSPDTSATTDLTNWIFSSLSTPLTQSIVGAVLLFLQAAIVNRIVIVHRLTNHITLYSGVLYATLVCIFPSYSMLSEYLIANTFILIGISSIFRTFHNKFQMGSVLNTGLFMGIALLLAPDYTAMILFGLCAIMLFTASVNNFLQYIIGLITVAFLYGSFNYLMGYYDNSGLELYVPTINTDLITNQTYKSLEVIFLGVLILYSLYLSEKMKLKKNVSSRKKITALFYLLFVSFLTVIFYVPNNAGVMCLPLISLGMILGINFSRFRNSIMVELFYLSLVGITIYLNFFMQ